MVNQTLEQRNKEIEKAILVKHKNTSYKKIAIWITRRYKIDFSEEDVGNVVSSLNLDNNKKHASSSKANIKFIKNFIRDNWEDKTDKQIAEILKEEYHISDITHWQVQRYRQSIGILRNTFNPSLTDEMKDYIRSNYQLMTDGQIQEEFYNEYNLIISAEKIGDWRRAEGLSKETSLLDHKSRRKELLNAYDKNLEIGPDTLFWKYFLWWSYQFKESSVRPVTFNKYLITTQHLKDYMGDVKIKNLSRLRFQKYINDLGETRTEQTLKDEYNQVNSCFKDMEYEGLIDKNPAYKISINAMVEAPKKKKYLSEWELNKLLESLQLVKDNLNKQNVMDWLILFLARTGARFSEGLGITRKDLNLEDNTVTINKTFDYKGKSTKGFDKTKNKGSIRTIYLDEGTIKDLLEISRDLEDDEPIFISLYGGRLHNSMFVQYLRNMCREAGITQITPHSLRHTHTSILLEKGVNILSVAKRLGHSNTTTTQRVYSHITDELSKKDAEIIAEIIG